MINYFETLTRKIVFNILIFNPFLIVLMALILLYFDNIGIKSDILNVIANLII